MNKEYVLASDNAGKLREMVAMFEPLGFIVHLQSDFQVPPGVAETGSTFIENALIKARHAAEYTAMACIADDSGLVVPALQGAPGIYSARYAGEPANAKANMDKLLDALAGMQGKDRAAHFYCAMVCLASADDPAPLVATGAWHGHILTSPQGDGGFGYDPVFAVTAVDGPDPQRSAAEMSAAEKARYSHRGQALRKLARILHQPVGGLKVSN
jgi:XTP/dITP diphosphohydrolase